MADAIDADLDDGRLPDLDRLQEYFRPQARTVPAIAVDLVPLSAYDELAAVCSTTAQALEVLGAPKWRSHEAPASCYHFREVVRLVEEKAARNSSPAIDGTSRRVDDGQVGAEPTNVRRDVPAGQLDCQSNVGQHHIKDMIGVCVGDGVLGGLHNLPPGAAQFLDDRRAQDPLVFDDKRQLWRARWLHATVPSRYWLKGAWRMRAKVRTYAALLERCHYCNVALKTLP